MILSFWKFLSINQQIDGKIIKPNGRKKYGGNNSDVKKPKIKKNIVFNYLFLSLLFQFFDYLI